MKNFKILVVALAAMLLSSCEKEYITKQYVTEEYVTEGSKVIHKYVEVQKEDWRESGNSGEEGAYLYAMVPLSEITKDVVESGCVLAFLIDADNRDNILPYVYPYQTESISSKPSVIETLRFDAEQGKITFIAQDDDFLFYPRESVMVLKTIINDGKTSTTKYFNISPSDWRENGNPGEEGAYLYATILTDAITEDVINEGSILSYFVDDAGRDNPLPYVYPYAVGNVLTSVTENLRYDVEEGVITFIAQNDDFLFYPRTGKYSFKIIIVESKE